ncbi:hypothetical protein HGRIS_009913 [Hohenbuehelia grisea]|uniref:Peptidase M43 pregnancy-associated plasma-A domain-containing protein n=1 Tax=Hohenbuehelia grisea TaxID=104357 RepID=A0ABR3J2L4_9AGAR
MLSTKFLPLLSAVVSVLAGPASEIPDPSVACGNALWDNTTASAIPDLHHHYLESRQLRYQPPVLPDAGSKVKVYWSVIYNNNSPDGGNIDDASIHHQIKVLNNDFAPVGLSFELVDIKRTYNPSWFNLNYGDYNTERAMKRTIDINNPAVLKIFSNVSPSRVSWAFLPDLSTPPADLDGVVLHLGSLASQNNPGHTLTHEVGHWSGLYHTFNRGCESGPEAGDKVADTAPHKQGNWQCDQPVYSCGFSQPDPTDNYMNYVYDRCRNRFTPGQIERMRRQLKIFRGITLGQGTAKGDHPQPPPNTGSSLSNYQRPTRHTYQRPTNSGNSYRRPTSYKRPGTSTGSYRPTTGYRPTNNGHHRTTGNTGYRRPSTGYHRPTGNTGYRRPTTYRRPTGNTGNPLGIGGNLGQMKTQANNMLKDVMSQLKKIWSFMASNHLF